MGDKPFLGRLNPSKWAGVGRLRFRLPMSLLALACLSLTVLAVVPVACRARMSVELIVDFPIYPGNDARITVRVKNEGTDPLTDPPFQVTSVSVSFDWSAKQSYAAEKILIDRGSHEDFSFTVHVPEGIATDIGHTVTVVIHGTFTYEGRQGDVDASWEFTIPVSKQVPTTITARYPTAVMTGLTIVFPFTTPPGRGWNEPAFFMIALVLIMICVVLLATAIVIIRRKKGKGNG